MYRSYRGSRRKSGCLIPILVALCIVAALVLFFVQRNVSFTPEGMVLRLPFTDKTVLLGKGEEVPEEDVNLVIDAPEEPEKEPFEEPKEEPEEPVLSEYETRIVKSIFVPRSVVLDASAFDALLAQAKDSEINTFVLEVKAENGRLAFASTAELAANSEANASDNTALKNALTKLEMQGIHAVAQMSCFRDNRAPRNQRALAVRTKKKALWLDPDEFTWLNPYSADAVAYLKTVLTDLYTLGFEEVMLTNVSFPVKGRTSLISYAQAEETTQQAAITAFAQQMRAVAVEKGKQLSFFYDNQTPTEEDPVPGGQKLTDLMGVFYRIYGAVEPVENGRGVDTAVLDAMQAAIGEAGFPTRFVPVLTIASKTKAADLVDLAYSAQSKGTGCLYYQPDGNYDNILFGKSDEE